jgi:hypothetical protein
MQKIRASLLVLSAALLSGQIAAGQTAAELEDLLNTKEIAWAEAAYFTLGSSAEAAGVNGQARQAAFQFAREQGWLPKNAEAAGKARLGELSLLIMRSFNIPGGLMYRLFHNARYAYREMKARGFIRGRVYAGDTVSGAEFLYILGEALSYTGDAAALEGAAPLPEAGRDNAGEHQGLSAGSEAVQD